MQKKTESMSRIKNRFLINNCRLQELRNLHLTPASGHANLFLIQSVFIGLYEDSVKVNIHMLEFFRFLCKRPLNKLLAQAALFRGCSRPLLYPKCYSTDLPLVYLASQCVCFRLGRLLLLSILWFCVLVLDL